MYYIMLMKQSDILKDVADRTSRAVAHYWNTRSAQKDKQKTAGLVKEDRALYEVRPAKKRLE